MSRMRLFRVGRRGVGRALLTAAATLPPRNTVPQWLVRSAQTIGGRGSLEPESAVVGPDLLPAPLDGILSGWELGTWALGPATLRLLVDFVAVRKPRLAIEFGSGASTIALAWAMGEYLGTNTRHSILSIEQDVSYAAVTRSRLERWGLQGAVNIVEAPLASRVIEGVTTTCYDLPPSFQDLMGGRRADLILIDGPAGAPGIRFGTVPLIRHLAAPGATFFLDDALRSPEIDIARRWSQLSYVHVHHTVLVEKGVLVGTVEPDGPPPESP